MELQALVSRVCTARVAGVAQCAEPFMPCTTLDNGIDEEDASLDQQMWLSVFGEFDPCPARSGGLRESRESGGHRGVGQPGRAGGQGGRAGIGRVHWTFRGS